MELLNEDDYRRQMLLAVVEKAIGGDMKAFEAVREILSETNREEDSELTIRLGKGVEELAK